MAEVENVNDILALEYIEHSTAIRECADDVGREVLSSGGGGGFSSAKPSSAEKQPNEKLRCARDGAPGEGGAS